MPTINASFWRDNNRIPLTEDGFVTSSTETLTANNTTANLPLFRITGNVEVRGLWGVVTTVIGANHTAAYWRLNDQTAQVNVTLNTGTAISAAAVGSSLMKKGLAAAAIVLNNASAGRVTEPTTLETPYFSPFVVTAKNGANTDIEYVYTTTDTPTSGVIVFYLRWLPLSTDATVAAV